MRIEFFVPFPVKPKNKVAHVIRGGKIAAFPDQKVFKNAQSLASLCMPYRPEKPIEGPVMVRYLFKSRKPVSRKKSDHRKDTRADLGNLIKQMDDVLCECGFFKDDSQIWSYGNSCKVWSLTDNDLGVYVVVDSEEDYLLRHDGYQITNG